jgi:hypothetical protein
MSIDREVTLFFFGAMMGAGFWQGIMVLVCTKLGKIQDGDKILVVTPKVTYTTMILFFPTIIFMIALSKFLAKLGW